MPPPVPTLPSRRAWLLALGALAAAPAGAGPAARRDWPARRPTPALQLALLDGSPWRLEPGRGAPLLLHFWATWCEPCREELPALAALAGRVRPRGLAVQTVAYREPAATVRRYLDSQALELPVALDADGRAAQAFEVRLFPSTVLIDRQGQVRATLLGACDWAGPEGQRVVDTLLAG